MGRWWTSAGGTAIEVGRVAGLRSGLGSLLLLLLLSSLVTTQSRRDVLVVVVAAAASIPTGCDSIKSFASPGRRTRGERAKRERERERE